jgi:hypothetical protein
MAQTQIETTHRIPVQICEDHYAELAELGEGVINNPDSDGWRWAIGGTVCTYMRNAGNIVQDGEADGVRVLQTFDRHQGTAYVNLYIFSAACLSDLVKLELEPEEVNHPRRQRHIYDLARLHLGLGVEPPTEHDEATLVDILSRPTA